MYDSQDMDGREDGEESSARGARGSALVVVARAQLQRAVDLCEGKYRLMYLITYGGCKSYIVHVSQLEAYLSAYLRQGNMGN